MSNCHLPFVTGTGHLLEKQTKNSVQALNDHEAALSLQYYLRDHGFDRFFCIVYH